jgi:hypothetical protein
MRYSADGLHDEFGGALTLLDHRKEAHHTLSGTVQQSVYCYCRKIILTDRKTSRGVLCLAAPRHTKRPQG